jgi:transcriptional regulator with XRE-family HTH domain
MLFQQQIKKLMDMLQQYGYTKVAIADESGITRAMIDRWTKHQHEPRKESLWKFFNLCEEVLGLNVEKEMQLAYSNIVTDYINEKKTLCQLAEELDG